MRVVPTGASGAPPAAEDVSAFLDSIFVAQTSQASLDAAYALTSLLNNSAGVYGLSAYPVLQRIRKAAADKKNGTARESAMILLGALFERMPPAHLASEVVYLVQERDLVPLALDALADKGGVVRESAQYALDALFANLRAEALVVGLLPVLMRYLEKRTGKWQGTVGAFELMARMADKAKMGTGSKEQEKEKDVLREIMGKKLAALIPIVESGMHDLKSEVGISCPCCAGRVLIANSGRKASHEGHELFDHASVQR